MENWHVVFNVVLSTIVIDHVSNLLAAPVNDPVVAIKRFGSTVDSEQKKENNVSDQHAFLLSPEEGERGTTQTKAPTLPEPAHDPGLWTKR
jgi:hypothetical protein